MSDAISYEVPWARTHQFDPPAVFDALRAERPLARMTYPDGHEGWIATGHEVVREVLGDPRFSHSTEIGHFPVTHQGQLVPNHPKIPGMFIHMDPPDHTRYRRLLTGEFTVRRASRLKARVEAVAAEQIDVMRAHGSPADLVETFARPLVLRVLSELVGLPYDEREHYEHAPTLLHDPDANPQEVAAAFEKAGAFFVEVIERKRKNPGDDLLSRLTADGQLTTEELCNIVVLLLFAGYETTESALSVGVFALLHHAEQLAVLRADPEKLDTAVEELLRYLTVNQYHTYRTALEDIELNGETVKKGDTVTVSLPAANRDPAKFTCPEKLDIGRDTAGHVAFGYGIHQCLGQNLARVELRAGIAALLGAFPDLRLAVATDEVPLRLKGSVFAVKGLPVSW
ncbi:cytochrome P450 [Streptomyces sp. NRRL B-1347]|uniref:Cytochrome P450 n=1 Tax=Streptomyces spectabilis TaxID=68270 RepID=A0A286SBZ2_STRST|nr:cytochrome P450 [Streptomyces sp. NRRL B-1347]ASZ00146.1 cytochrome P450 [Streptomyces spectabilis]